jgi:hypothetical protein
MDEYDQAFRVEVGVADSEEAGAFQQQPEVQELGHQGDDEVLPVPPQSAWQQEALTCGVSALGASIGSHAASIETTRRAHPCRPRRRLATTMSDMRSLLA